MAKPVFPRRKQKINLAESIFFVLLVSVSLFILLRSPLFEVKNIEVKGNGSMTAERIIEISGITPGTNIFKLDLAGAGDNLRVLPIIKDVEMRRVLPSRVSIEVTERKPVALVQTQDGFIEVDGDGIYLRKGKITGSGLPLLTGDPVTAPAPGQVVPGKDLPAALKVVTQLPEILVRELSEVYIDAQGRAVLYTIDGIQCRLGRVEDISEKGNVFLQVSSELRAKGRKIEYVDLSYQGVPTVKYLDE